MEVGMLKGTALVFLMLATAYPGVAQDDTALPDGAGKAIVQKMCVSCHSLKTVTSNRATKEQWSDTVQQMVSRGAEGTDEEIATVIDYLAKNFPPVEKDKNGAASHSVSIEKGILPDGLSSGSMLTMSQENLEAMLRRWKQ
jgi:mono/diheme cytochrome c family protein